MDPTSAAAGTLVVLYGRHSPCRVAPAPVRRVGAGGTPTPQNRDGSGRFLKGQSGNPGGRPKGFAERIRAETRDGADLVGFVVRVLHNPRAKTTDRLTAATWLADRGFGGPVQAGQDDRLGLADLVTINIIGCGHKGEHPGLLTVPTPPRPVGRGNGPGDKGAPPALAENSEDHGG